MIKSSAVTKSLCVEDTKAQSPQTARVRSSGSSNGIAGGTGGARCRALSDVDPIQKKMGGNR